MIGARIYPNEARELRLAEGDYGRDCNGVWWCRPPGCHAGTLDDHQVTEHEDGTISVSPSIAADPVPSERRPGWHGHLERGVWRAA